QFVEKTRLNALMYYRGVVPQWMLTNPQGREMAEFAEWFFYTVMVVQFAAVLFLTPAYTAGAVAEEKDRKTLEFLFATDLSNREIVLSKLASRIFTMALIVLTGL